VSQGRIRAAHRRPLGGRWGLVARGAGNVVAVLNALKTGGVSASPGPPAVTMGQGLTILALRTTDGHPLGDEASSNNSTRVVVPPKLGSVVVAIPAARLVDFATASLTSSFYLALDSAAPLASAAP
jgi:hypothetical protein